MQNKYGDRLRVLGLTKADEQAARAFVEEFGVNYPVKPEADAEFEAFGISVVPSAKLIDPQGRVVADSRRMGALSRDSGEIDAILARELG